jgi:branched-chain amino acid transport system ATP-binding protein
VSVIETRGLVAGHGGVPAVRDLDLHVDEGEVVALLGPNGAGKTTTLSTIAGLLPVMGGEVHVMGQPVHSSSAHAVARRGLALLPEDRGVFFQLTVAENLRLNRHRHSRRTADEVIAYFPALDKLRSRRCGLLSGGEQQMLAMACKLIADPRALMVDELSLGLAPIIVERLLPVVRDIADESGMGVLLVEQHITAALEVADRAYVLNHGRLVLSGDAKELLHSREMVEASYLGSAVLDRHQT